MCCIISNASLADNWFKAYENSNHSSYGFSSLVLPSGDIIAGVRSFDNDIILIKTDKNGKLLKEQRMTKTKLVKKVILTNDNLLFICGMTDSSDASGENIFWMKVDLNFNVIWSSQSTRNFNDICESAIQYSDGTYYIVGYGSRTGNSLSDRDAFIYHIGADGDFISAKISNSFGADYFNNIKEAPDGSLFVIGTKIYQVAMDMYLAKFSKDLNMIQGKTFGGLEDESAYDIIFDNSTFYILGGTHSFGAGNYDISITKFDLNFNIINTKTYGNAINESAVSFLKVNNELVVLANMDTIFVKDSTYVPTKLLFLRTSMNLDLLDSYFFDKSSSITSLSSLSLTGDNEIVVGFTTTGFSSSNLTNWALLKTDSFKLNCCDYIKPISLVQKDIVFPERAQTFTFNNAGLAIGLGVLTGLESFKIVSNCGGEKDTANIKKNFNTSYCKNEPITLTTNASIDPIKSTWIFGDTISIIDTAKKEITYAFDTVGFFNIYYIAEFQCNSDTDTIRIEITNSREHEVELKRDGYCINTPITFGVETSTAEIIRYHWDFGIVNVTNDTSNIDTPKFIFKKAGTYTIRLTSRSYCGQSVDSISITIAEKSTVEINNNVKTYCKNFTVPFDIDVVEIPVTTTWDFGDPTASTNTATGLTAQHIYTKSGTYICRVISDFNCSSDTDTIHITIVDFFKKPANITYIGECVNESFDFSLDNTLSNPNYYWYLEDNGVGVIYYTKSFSHLFSKQGTYTIIGIVSNTLCEQGMDTIILNVAEFSKAEIITINDPCLQNIILEPTNNSTNVKWILSDGYSSTEKTLVHSFPSSGDYTVKLITNPSSSCADSVEISIPFTKENSAGGVYIPQVFSPNGDGNNDKFIIENSSNNPCKLKSFKVYDRWGKIIHSVNQFETFEWDGKFNGSNVMPGAYIGFLETEQGSNSFVIHVVY